MTTDSRLLRLSPQDNVLVARASISAGESLLINGQIIVASTTIPLGYKVAAQTLDTGTKIIKYGAPIGSATCRIEAGEIAHTHNMQSDYLPTYQREEGRFVDGH
jgi:hypothetical protein